MGAWSTSVAGNDTAQDLKSEYACAFFRYPPEEALEKIETYVRSMFDESDPEEWCAYVYSLADFMWKKGILTDAVKQRALDMIDSGFGLDIWAESGEKTLRERKKALEKFRAQILSPMGKPKKIKPDIRTEDIFTDGDVVAVKLMTAGKGVASHAYRVRPMTDEAFHALDGKYILMQKAWCKISWQSALVPEVADHWAIFRLFDGVYDTPPVLTDISGLQEAAFHRNTELASPYFCCESSMFYFKRRKFEVLGNFPPSERYRPDNRAEHVYLGISNQFWDPDALFLSAMTV